MNVFTVDLEEWFHICDAGDQLAPDRWETLPSRAETTTRRVLDLLDHTQVPATFFIVGWVAERHPRLVEEILAAGHEVGSHSYWHRRAYDLGPDAFRTDLQRSVRALRDAGATTVTSFRAPEWSINNRSLWALDVLIEEGYRYDSSIFPIRHDRYGIPVSDRRPYRIDRPAGTLMEVPGSTTQLGPLNLPVAGGGYFRPKTAAK